MTIEELKPSIKKEKRTRRGRGMGSGLGKTSGRGQKDKKQDLVEELDVVSKVVKHHYIEDCQKEDLIINLLKTTLK